MSECIPQKANEVCSEKSVPSPAKKVGILPGDKVTKVNGQIYEEWVDVIGIIRASSGKQIEITVERNGMPINFLVTPASRDLNGEKVGVLGVINTVGTITYAPFTATAKATKYTGEILKNSLTSLFTLPAKIPDLVRQTFGGEKRDEQGLVGVVGVARVSGETASTDVLTVREKVATFILIIAICNIIGSVTMLIIDKQKDIAVLRTLGATKNQIQKIYFYEGMMISLLGTFIGLFIGAGFAVLQAKFKLISIYSSTGAYLQAYPVKLIYTDFLLVFATVFIIAFIANWFSAKQSSNASNNIRWAIAAN